ncbi:non-heme iron oxygenase ferredoxin subunit [Saccharothrix obliqua]|uniref:non-heme iron oxygenase ferredoxin subunit n=1 Tax=Saccharothrix obliqua TaxID=2861747 RepID=UPI001C5DDCED|nr:non-heme iron oxygenase ferredoxin subunit [Saccharothrix obliqua]MBW4717753.1 non-heme iron oxygenase ferredoxin subunit [Saccharothrix obliqua]
MAERPHRRVLVCGVDELPAGVALRVPREETGTGGAIAVFNDGGRLYAVDDRCPHAHAPLSAGLVRDGRISCPLDGGTFCLRTGRALAPPASAGLTTHPVEVRDDTIWLLPRP